MNFSGFHGILVGMPVSNLVFGPYGWHAWSHGPEGGVWSTTCMESWS